MRSVCIAFVALASLLVAAPAVAEEETRPSEKKLDVEALAARLTGKPVSFVFVVQDPTRSSSLMGHVWVNFGEGNAQTGELAQDGTAFEFAAETGEDSAFTSTTKGLFGGYTGELHDYPTWQIVDRYRARQGRDFWVYRLRLSAEEQARLVAAVVKEQGSTFEYRFATNNSATTLGRLLGEAFAPGKRRDEVRGGSVVTPASLAAALVEVGAVDGEPTLVRTEAHAKSVAELGAAPAPKPHENHAPMRLDAAAGYAEATGRYETTVGFRLGVHELVEPAVREFDTAGGVLLRADASVDEKGVVRLARATLLELEAFGFEDGSNLGWGARVGLGYLGRGRGVFGGDSLALGGAYGVAFRVRGSLGELLGYARASAEPGMGFGVDGAQAQLPFGVHGGLLVHGAGSLSLRSEAGVYRALPWSYGTGVFSTTEMQWRFARDYAFTARMIATEDSVSPSAGLAVWYP
jgi:hypothetical protein